MFKLFSVLTRFLRYPLTFGIKAVYLLCVFLVPVANAQEASQAVDATVDDCDYSNANSLNGWGWNPITRESCAPVSEEQQVVDASVDDCDYSNADSLNGWGWNPITRESCVPVSEEQQVVEVSVDDCDYSNADSFNGWGWNPATRESCAPINEEQQVVEASVGDCDYSNADSFNGWGWNPIVGESCAPISAADGPVITRESINNLDWPESGGGSGSDISANGRYIAITSRTLSPFDSNQLVLFVRDTVVGLTRQLVPDRSRIIHDGLSSSGITTPWSAVISADGRFVAFGSEASTLTAEEDTNGVQDIFVYDLQMNVITAITHGEKSSYAPDVSHDGRYVSFQSEAKLSPNDQNNRTDVYVHDRLTGNNTLVSVTPDGVASEQSSAESKISGDGRFVLFESKSSDFGFEDTRGIQAWHRDTFQYDLQTGETRLLSADANGAALNRNCNAQGISSNGSISLLTCDDLASNNSGNNMYIYNQETDSMSLLDFRDEELLAGQRSIRVSGETVALSDDGRYVVFSSVTRMTSVPLENIGSNTSLFSTRYFYRHDRITKTTTWLANNVGVVGGISADGRFVPFISADNLTANDANEFSDIYLVDFESDSATSLSIDPLCTTADCSQFGIDWVWDGDISHGVITNIETLTEAFYEGVDCVDLDGDGFGWQKPEGTPGRSCLVQ